MGLTGVITEATLQLQPVETSRIVSRHRAQPPTSTTAWRACSTATTTTATRSRGSTASRRAAPRPGGAHARQPRDARRAADRRSVRTRASTRPGASLGAPPWLPNGLINPLSIRAFNEVWFRKAPRTRRGDDREHQPVLLPARRRARLEPRLRLAAASCSTSSSCRSAPKRSCARRSNGSARPGSRRSSRCSSASSTTAAA